MNLRRLLALLEFGIYLGYLNNPLGNPTLSADNNQCMIFLLQVFMLRRASEEPTGHAAAIMTEVLVNAECNGIINTAQKRLLLQQMALRLA